MTRRLSCALACALLSCSNVAPVTPVVALHDLHQPSTPVVIPTNEDDFYRLPFPNDVRLRADGTADLSRYPRDVGVVKQYIDIFDGGLHGFGTNAGIYFRFDGAIDPTTLPADVPSSLSQTATAWVVDVTPGSPTYGTRTPITVDYVPLSYDFIGPNWIVMLPFPGAPLREKTTYAALLGDGIRDASGHPVVRSSDFAAVMNQGASSGDPRIAAAAKTYAPLTNWLATQPGVSDHIVNATVFTTLDATGLMNRLRKTIYEQVTAPVIANLGFSRHHPNHDEFVGSYAGPNFQQGDPPYALSGGAIVEVSGVPQLQRMEQLRVAIAIPHGNMPAHGWPIVIYSPGTGGDYQWFEVDGSADEAANVRDASGNPIAQMAMICVDPVLSGPRAPAGSDPNFTFFNYRNPVGARFNPMQGALDEFQLLRLVKSISVTAAPTTGVPILFDPDRIYYKGHSQGALTGALFLAAEPEVKAAVMSGAGSNLILSVLNKHVPVDIATLVAAIFRDPVDIRHPVLNLLQAYLEQSDPANYVRYFFSEPPSGFAPKSVFQSLGLNDPESPPAENKAEALAERLQPVLPMLDPISALDLFGLMWATAPVSSNVAGEKATGVLLEYDATNCNNSHLVLFCNPKAIAQSNRFLATHAATGVARVDPP
jgi:hypothetical protein